MKNQRTNGFTLIELMVVVAIISILAGALLVVINPISIQQKSRDSKRLQEMDTLRNAIYLALSDGEIALVDTSTACGADGCDQTEGSVAMDGSGYVKFSITGVEGLSKFIPTLPLDPLSTGTYIYASDGTDFEINAILEHTDNASKMINDGGSSDDYYEIGSKLNVI